MYANPLLLNKRIFIVEDNPLNRSVFNMTLHPHGAHLGFENLGLDVTVPLRLFGQVDLIILDLMLRAGISGFDIYSQIRMTRGFQHTPIVAISAMDAGIAVPKALALGFNGYIAKPVDADTLPQLLSRVLLGDNVWQYGAALV